MDRIAHAAVRLPPVARLACSVACVLFAVLAGFPAPAAARALPPPPQRLAVVWGRPAWSGAPGVALEPPPARWGAEWAGGDPPILPTALRSLHG